MRVRSSSTTGHSWLVSRDESSLGVSAASSIEEVSSAESSSADSSSEKSSSEKSSSEESPSEGAAVLWL